MVVWALYFYAAGLVAHSMVEVLARAFYAIQNTIIPAGVSVGGMIANVLFSLLFVQFFLALGWMPHGALALANSLATYLEMGALLLMLRRKIGKLFDSGFWKSAGRTALSSFAMLAALLAWRELGVGWSIWIVGPAGILIGLGVYVAASLAVGSQESIRVLQSLARRIPFLARKSTA
jgi:putative peptidoglycan lipid II flippase